MKKLIALVLIALLCLGVLAGCSGKAGLEDAKEYLDSIMKPKAEKTPADYEVLNKVMIGQDEYTIEWSVDVQEGVKVVVAEDGKVTIDVDERAEADIPYVLTAIIKNAKGKTIETSYNRKVPAFKELTWAEFTATADDEAVVVKGVITGIVNTDTKHELYLEDADGGYYVYNLDAEKMEGLAIGMEIRVLGIRDTYYGVNQVVEASVEIINSTPAPVTPTDITDAVKAAPNLKDATLTKYQSMLVTIKGADVLGQDKSNTTYYNFAIGDKISYVRISGSANMLSEADTTTFEENVADNIGKSATVTGLVSIYNNQIYIIPVTVDAFADFAVVERTPEGQVEYEKKFMAAIGNITEAGTVTLNTTPLLYSDVVITWSLATTEYATLSGDKLTVSVLPDEAQKITLTATLTSGEASTTKDFEVTINAAPTIVGDVVASPVVGTAYKFMLKQKNTKQTLYFIGSIDSNGYLETSTNPEKAVDVYLEAVDGKDGEYYFYYTVGGTGKAYVTVSDVNGKKNVSYARAGSNTYKYDAERCALTTTVTIGGEEKTYYFGTYNSYTTIGTSELKYIEDTSVIGTSQFVANFASMIDITTVSDADKVAREKNDLSIKTSFASAGGSVELPLTGSTFAKVIITWAVADNNGAVAIVDGKLVATPQADETTVKVTATITHGDVTESKEFNVTVAAKPTVVPVKVTTVTTGKAYKLGIYQETLGKLIFFNGNDKYNNYYFGSTDVAEDGVDIYLEEAETEGKYYAYTTINSAKKYINIVVGEHINPTLTDTATTEFTFDEDLGTLIITVGEGDEAASYTYGTYGNFDSIGGNKLGSSTTFYSALYEMIDTATVTDADKLAQEKEALTIETLYKIAGEETLPTAGFTYDNVVITWEVADNNGAVAIVDGKLVATPQAAETTVKVTATLAIGETSVTKEFDVVVAKEIVLVQVLVTSAPEAGKDYYIGLIYQEKYVFLNGGVGNAEYRLAFTQVFDEMAAFRLEATEGGFYLATTVDGTKKYVNIVEVQSGEKTYINSLYQDTATSVWVWNDTYKTITVTVAGSEYAITNTGFANVEAKVVTYSGGIQAQLYTLVDESTITDEAKVNSEKDALEIETNYKIAGEETLPTAGFTYNNVVITWEVADNDGAVAIVDGKLVATPQAAETTVKVTATLAIGETSVTKEFNVVVAKAVALVPMLVTAPEAGKDYYIGLIYQEKYVFLNGGVGNAEYRLAFTQVFDEMAVFQLEATEGGFYLATTVDGTKKYVNIVEVQSGETTYINSLYQETATSVWVWNDTYKTITVTVAGSEYAITNTGFANVEAKVVTYSGGIQAQIYTIVKETDITDEEKAAYAAGNISVVDKMELDGEIVLPVVDSVIDSATIAWAITEDTLGAATLNENKLTIALKESAGVLKLTATVTVGEATETKIFEIALSAKSNDVIKTVSFASTASRVSIDTNSQIWKEGDVTVTNNKGASTSNVADYSNPVRFYKNSTLIVEYTGMKKIVFVCDSSAYATDLATSLTTSGYTAVASGVEVTVEFDTAIDKLEVVLSGGQVRMDEIKVYA